MCFFQLDDLSVHKLTIALLVPKYVTNSLVVGRMRTINKQKVSRINTGETSKR